MSTAVAPTSGLTAQKVAEMYGVPKKRADKIIRWAKQAATDSAEEWARISPNGYHGKTKTAK